MRCLGVHNVVGGNHLFADFREPALQGLQQRAFSRLFVIGVDFDGKQWGPVRGKQPFVFVTLSALEVRPRLRISLGNCLPNVHGEPWFLRDEKFGHFQRRSSNCLPALPFPAALSSSCRRFAVEK